MADLIASVKGAGLVARAAKVIIDKLGETAPNARLREAWEVEQRSWRAQREAAIEVRVARLEALAEGDPTFAGRAAAMADDHQFRRLQANVEYEALREATDERRRMLAYAAAGLCDPSMPLNLKARIERTLRGLDPIDVATLRRITFLGVLESGATEQDQPISVAALLAAGCIRGRDGGDWDSSSHVEATALGTEVLKVLSDYSHESETGDA